MTSSVNVSPFIHTRNNTVQPLYAFCQTNISLSSPTSSIYRQQCTAPHPHSSAPFLIVFASAESWERRAKDGEVKSIRGEIPEMAISEVRRARVTDGPVQTTQFSPQELTLNFSAAGRHTWREGGNGGKRWSRRETLYRGKRGKM